MIIAISEGFNTSPDTDVYIVNTDLMVNRSLASNLEYSTEDYEDNGLELLEEKGARVKPPILVEKILQIWYP